MRGKLSGFCLLFIITLLLSEHTRAQSATSADVLGAKSYLEGLIVRSFSQSLSTRVDADAFNVGATLQIIKSKPQEKPATREPFSDLQLGFLNPEELLKTYSAENDQVTRFLENYRIRKVDVHVGLKSNLGEEVRADVEKWLTERVRNDFGSIGSGQVHAIHLPTQPAQVPPRQMSLIDHLKEFQDLAGQIILGLALLFGVILWKMLSGSSEKSASGGASVNVNNQIAGSEEQKGSSQVESDITEERKLIEKVDKITQQIFEITPQVGSELEKVVKEWCGQGQQGLLQVACFAEISGKALGGLPIPSDLRKEVTEVFGRMYNLGVKDKFEALQKVYWDLLAVINLGSGALHQPFSFLGTAPVNTVNQVLLDTNAKMQTIVSLFMPAELRKSYIESLDEARKLEVLSTAAQLSEISEDELENMESQLVPYFESGEKESNVTLDMTLERIIDVMSIAESCVLLRNVICPAVSEYNSRRPSLAFLHEWPADDLRLLLGRATSEEMTAFLSVRPDMDQVVLATIAPKARQILEDDLKNRDQIKESDREVLLRSIEQKLNALVSEGEIDLKRIFSQTNSETSDDQQAA